MSRLIRAVIDTQALRDNLARIRGIAAGRRVVAVVKANGYGHGSVTVARALAGADAFAVARLEEGAVLRDAGITGPILLLEGVLDRGQLAEAAARDFDLVVHDESQLALLEDWRGPHRFALWLKANTGMNRLGFDPAQFAAAQRRLAALAVPAATLRLMTHLARADERGCAATPGQLARFAALAAPHDLETSIANSAGIFGSPAAHGDWVRPGLALYGVSPFPHESAASLGLTPAMTLLSTVIAVREVRSGECVGYGGVWSAPGAARVAVLAAGYADGLLRSLPSGAPVQVGGQRAALVGRVSMDMITVDVTGLAGIEVGSPAMLWGPGLPVEDLALCANTIPYELLCAVTQRVAFEVA